MTTSTPPQDWPVIVEQLTEAIEQLVATTDSLQTQLDRHNRHVEQLTQRVEQLAGDRDEGE